MKKTTTKKKTVVPPSAGASAPAPRCPRSKWIGFILYQDNCYHMQMLEYFKTRFFDMAYILHDKDKLPDGSLKKPHYHLMVYFDTARTASGYANDKTYYGFFVETEDETKKDKDGKPKKVYKAVMGQDKELAEKRGDKVVKRALFVYGGDNETVFTIHHPQEYYHYLVHDTFMAHIEGKTPYPWEAVKHCGNVDKMSALRDTEFEQHSVIIQSIAEYFTEYKTCRAVMGALIRDGRYDLIKYCEGHALFLRHFFEVWDERGLNNA